MSQHWPLSQKTNKNKGTCSHCMSVCQLHLKNGSVHLHGPRAARCPGSNKPPLAARIPSASPLIFACPAIPSVAQSGCQIKSGVFTSYGAQSPSFHDPSLSEAPIRPIILGNPPVPIPAHNHNPTLDTGINLTIPTDNTAILSYPRVTVPILKHIPKSARPSCCQALTGILSSICSNNQDPARWNKLFNFCPVTFQVPPKDGSKTSITDILKSRVAGAPSQANHGQKSAPNKRKVFELARAVSSKIEDGNIRAALRLLSSDDKPTVSSDAALTAMLARHPPAPIDRVPTPDPNSHTSLQITEEITLKAIKSFPSGSSGGPDGFRPQHLLELVTCQSHGPALLSAVTRFVNLVLDGGCPAFACPIFLGVNCSREKVWRVPPHCHWLHPQTINF